MTQPLDFLDVISLGSNNSGESGRGRYEVLHQIDASGSHQVFEVRDTQLNRNVVLKCLLPHLLEREGNVEAFFEHMQFMAVLHHPGIPAVFEYGRLAPDGRPFGTMNHVHGTKLSDLLKKRSSPRDDLFFFLGIFQRVSQAMAFAHARNIVNRSLSPAHIFVSDHGDVQIMDWTFAKSLAHAGGPQTSNEQEGASVISVFETVRSGRSGSGPSDSTMLVGAYMSPEQAMGFESQMDERSDVFSLGAILCEILTGSPPYTTDTGNLIIQASRCDLESVFEKLDASRQHSEPHQLAKWCLCRSEQDRPDDAGVVSENITSWLQQQTAGNDSAAKSVPGNGSLRLQRNLIAGAALLLLIAFVWRIIAG